MIFLNAGVRKTLKNNCHCFCRKLKRIRGVETDPSVKRGMYTVWLRCWTLLTQSLSQLLNMSRRWRSVLNIKVSCQTRFNPMALMIASIEDEGGQLNRTELWADVIINLPFLSLKNHCYEHLSSIPIGSIHGAVDGAPKTGSLATLYYPANEDLCCFHVIQK